MTEAKKGGVYKRHIYGYSILQQQRVDNLLRQYYDHMEHYTKPHRLAAAVNKLWDIYGDIYGQMAANDLETVHEAIEKAERVATSPAAISSGLAVKTIRRAHFALGPVLTKLNLFGPQAVEKGRVSVEQKMRSSLILTAPEAEDDGGND